MTSCPPLGRKEIETKLPHKGFMLLPDSFEAFNNDGIFSGVSVMTIKEDNVFLPCHFDCFPGVMLVEFINQTAALLIKTLYGEEKTPMVMEQDDPPPRYGGIPVIMGDVVTATITLKRAKRGMFWLSGIVVNQKNETVARSGVTGTDAERAKERLAKKLEKATTTFPVEAGVLMLAMGNEDLLGTEFVDEMIEKISTTAQT